MTESAIQRYEVWCSKADREAEYSPGVPYVLLVMWAQSDAKYPSGIAIRDPLQGYRIVYEATDYAAIQEHLEKAFFYRVGEGQN